MNKISNELEKIGSLMEGLDLDWQIHFDGELEIDGMKLSVKFDKPVPASK